MGGGDPPTPIPFIFPEGVTPHPCAGASGGYPLPPLCPGPARSHALKNTTAGNLPSDTPREQPCISHAKTAGIPDPERGGDPPPPPPLSAQVGITPPPMWLSGWGVPPQVWGGCNCQIETRILKRYVALYEKGGRGGSAVHSE
jgi:hypothetical protein